MQKYPRMHFAEPCVFPAPIIASASRSFLMICSALRFLFFIEKTDHAFFAPPSTRSESPPLAALPLDPNYCFVRVD